MNERIRELAEQSDPEHWHNRWYSGINPRVMDPEIKKFAELIIRECADQVSRNAEAASILEHFGLE